MNPSLSSPSEVAPHSPETNAVPATGLTVLYQPVGGETIVDILFVHGLQGHPRATWSCKASRTSSERGSSTHLRVPSSDSFAFRSSPSPRHVHKKSLMKSIFKRRSWDPPSAKESVSTTALLEEPDQVFWPKDLLPKDCPEARIMTWGYDTIVTQGFSRPTTKSNIFAHAKDLLYALDRERAESRPIIFVCHSLGGIIVKEVLRRSQMSSEELIRDIVESTLAVLFLGTPHRGSAEFAALGDMMRRIGSVVLRLDSNATILRALGSDSPELELCRESFIAQWSRYNFHVKTFQEALGVTALNVGLLNEKVVPDTSSSLDDPREHAETIPANHMDMARFTGADDPGYRKVSGELRRLVQNLAKKRAPLQHNGSAASLTAEQKDCLRSLTYVELGMREARIRAALSNTCEWLFENAQFQEWSLGRNSEVSHGMLWLKGKPGAGKSTLVKAALHRIGQRRVRDFILTGFFFNARGAELERTPLGLFRSFLHQILEQDELLLEWFCGIYKAKCDSHRTKWEWTEEELETLLKEALATKGMKPVWMFIDALDECDEAKARDLVFYFRELTDTAYEAGRNLRVCLSSRHYPTITVERCPEIVVEDANHDDISRYVHSKLQSQQFAHGPLISALQNAIVSKASGIFLWVVLVVGIVLRLLDEGKTTREIEAILQMVPQDLDLLFSSLLKGVNDNERAKSLALVRWVLLARCQLSINDAYLAIMFSSETPYTSFGSWPQLREIQVHPQQIMRLIRNLSKGLIEVSSKGVQFIHESVREFFIHGRGLTILENRSETSSIRSGHLTIIRSCLNHIYLEELLPSIRPLIPRPSMEVSQWALSRSNCYWFSFYAARYLEFHTTMAEVDELIPPRLTELLGEIMVRLQRAWSLRDLGEVGWRILQWSPDLFSLTEEALHLTHQSIGESPSAEFKKIDGGVSHEAASKFSWWQLSRSKAAKSRKTQGLPGWTSLHKAACSGGMAAAGLSLEERYLINTLDSRGRTPTHIATLHHNAAFIRLLLSHEADPSLPDAAGFTALHFAARLGDADICQMLLESGRVCADARNIVGCTPLHSAVLSGSVEMARMLVRTGHDIDAQTCYGRTPLHLAVECGDAQMTRYLVDAGAHIYIPDDQDRTPIGIQVRYKEYFLGPMPSLDPRSNGGSSTNPQKMLASACGYKSLPPPSVTAASPVPTGPTLVNPTLTSPRPTWDEGEEVFYTPPSSPLMF